MATGLVEKLDKLGKKVSAKRAEVKIIESELHSQEADARPQLGTTSKQMISSVENGILTGEQLGLFETIPLSKTDVFPTLLARLPIFMPMSRQKQKELVDDDNYFHFTTPFGSGLRSGPLLTTRDEDTLLALERLRYKQLHGDIDKLPIKISSNLYNLDEKGKVHVDIVICTITMINEELDITDGGDNYNETLLSVRRLANTVIELTTKKKERYLSKCKEEGGQFKLLDVRWRAFDDDGLIFAQFSPVVTDWLANEYTYMDKKTRKALGKNDTAKALLRFLSTQPKSYNRNMIELAQCIGLMDDKRRIKPRMLNGVKALVRVGWLNHFEFIGNGRTKPVVLYTER
jgi:hypothetical protein